MTWIENLLIVIGCSLEIFAGMECQGALVQKINKKHLLHICWIVGLGQLLAMFLGYFLSSLLCQKNPISDEAILGEIVSMAIFLGLGVRLIAKAIKNERLEEHLQTGFEIKRLVRLASITAAYTVLAGIAFGFLSTSLWILLVMVVVITALCVIAGSYTGYHFGFEQKTKVYIIGAILFGVAGIDVLVRVIQGGSFIGN